MFVDQIVIRAACTVANISRCRSSKGHVLCIHKSAKPFKHVKTRMETRRENSEEMTTLYFLFIEIPAIPQPKLALEEFLIVLSN